MSLGWRLMKIGGLAVLITAGLGLVVSLGGFIDWNSDAAPFVAAVFSFVLLVEVAVAVVGFVVETVQRFTECGRSGP